LSSARARPAIADAVKGELKILVDSGIRTGLDVVRMLALGADCVMLGRAFVYALAAAGGAGVRYLLELFDKEMRVAMTLTGARSIGEIGADSLVRELRHATACPRSRHEPARRLPRRRQPPDPGRATLRRPAVDPG